MGGGTPPLVVVGGCEVVRVEAVAVGIVSLSKVSELTTCRARRVSKMYMQIHSGEIDRRLCAAYLSGYSSSSLPAVERVRDFSC